MITYLKMNIFIILLLEKINLYLLFYTFVSIIFTFIIKNENLQYTRLYGNILIIYTRLFSITHY